MSDLVIWNELGNIYLKIGAYDEAIAAYSQAIQVETGCGWTYCNLALAYCHKGRYSEAIPLYLKSIELFKSDHEKAISWKRLGEAYRELDDHEDEMAAYQMSLKLETIPSQDSIDSSDFAHRLALHRQTNNAEGRTAGEGMGSTPGQVLVSESPRPLEKAEAKEFLNWKMEINPTSTQEKIGKPQGNMMSGDSKDTGQESQTDLRHEESMDPVTIDSKKPSRFMLLMKGIVSPDSELEVNNANLNETRETCDQNRKDLWHEELPCELADQVKAADSNHQENDHKKPILLNQFPENSVRSHLDRYQLAETDASMQKKSHHENQNHKSDLENGIAYLKSITKNTPANDKAWDALGNLLRARGNYEDAVSAFEQAISLYPEKEEYHYHLGLVFSAQKRHDDAIREFQKVISLNPEYVLARGALAGNLRRIGREDEAAEQISFILPKMQDEKEYNRACFEAICGNTERAIELLRIALERKQTPLDWVRCDPDLDSIRDDPRFIDLVGRGI